MIWFRLSTAMNRIFDGSSNNGDKENWIQLLLWSQTEQWMCQRAKKTWHLLLNSILEEPNQCKKWIKRNRKSSFLGLQLSNSDSSLEESSRT